jgi:protein-disulfide isomerase
MVLINIKFEDKMERYKSKFIEAKNPYQGLNYMDLIDKILETVLDSSANTAKERKDFAKKALEELKKYPKAYKLMTDVSIKNGAKDVDKDIMSEFVFRIKELN